MAGRVDNPFDHLRAEVNAGQPQQTAVEGLIFGDQASTYMESAVSSSAATEPDVTSSGHVALWPVISGVQLANREEREEQTDMPIPLSNASWRSFSKFFSAGNYPYVDNSHNLSCHQFLSLWSQWFAGQDSEYYPRQFDSMPSIHINGAISAFREGIVSAHDLDPETCNFQGLNWKELGTTGASVRAARRKTYTHQTNKMDDIYSSPPSRFRDNLSRVRRYMDSSGMDWAKEIARNDNHFRFRQMFLEHRPYLAHFQLRNSVSASSRNAVFYAGASKVHLLNPPAGSRHPVMDLDHWRTPGPMRGTITTLSAADDILIAGGWEGEYAMKSCLSDNEGDEKNYTEGLLSQTLDASINHIHTFPDRRSGTTRAAFSSNDSHIRILDCSTNTLVGIHKLPSAINCSTTSPDGRLRLFVGDQTEPWILDADSGKVLVRLCNHKDFGFACDWAPDGVHAATGNQDGIVQIWDSRNWSQPIQILSTELSGVRALKFSPLGSGKRVLAMAEPADLVSIVDAEIFKSEQRFEFLGEIGGLSFPPDGQSLYVGNTDGLYGGILEFERAGHGEKYGMARSDAGKQGVWSVGIQDLDDNLLLQSSQSRKRRAISLGDVII